MLSKVPPSPRRNSSLLTPSARITVSLDWAPFPMSSMQLNPWQAQLWEQAIPIFVSIGDLTENHSGAQRPGVTADRLLIAIRRRSRIAASYPRQCIIPQLWMEASPCVPRLPGSGWWAGGDKGQVRQQSQLSLYSSTGNTGVPPGLRVPYHGASAASLHLPMLRELLEASLDSMGSAVSIKPTLSQRKKGTSNPAQPGIVTRKGVYFEWLPEPQGDWLSPWKHKCNLSAWPPAPKLRTNMACFSVWISEQSKAMSPSRLNARVLGLLPFLYPDLIKSRCWRKTSATQTGL